MFKRVLRSEIAQRGCVDPDATPHDLGDNPIRSEFNTTLENGQRTKLEETFYFDHDDAPATPDVAKSTTYDWVYDANDRLLSETINHHDDALDRTESFVMDLFGNRTHRKVDYVDPTAVDQAFAYSYDDNDRLGSETLDENADSSIDKTTQYTWDSTQQTAKEVFTDASTNPADLVSSQTFNYDLQGRLAEVITSPETGPATKVTYSYDSSGIRVSSSQFTDANTNGIFETSELDHTIEYLVDHRNHTGYAQTIAETTTDANGGNVKRITYTFGTDELSQTTYTPDPATADAWLAEAMHFFGHDAHGSVRVLLDALGEIAQTFTYAAYGELLAIYDATGALVGTLGAADTSAALTNLLYSGESFDSRIGQQYLRARWYDAAIDRFSRLDPYFGTLNDPLSFNKYLYVHSNPLAGIDPTGMFFGTSGLLASTSLHNSLQGINSEVQFAIKDGIQNSADEIQAVQYLESMLYSAGVVSSIPLAVVVVTKLGGLAGKLLGASFDVYKGFRIRKQLRAAIYNTQRPLGTAHARKHIKAKTVEEAIRLSKAGEASYLPGLARQVKQFEKSAARLAIKKGYIYEKGGTKYFYYRFNAPIGYNNGKPANWIRVELTSNAQFIHSFPANREQIPDTILALAKHS